MTGGVAARHRVVGALLVAAAGRPGLDDRAPRRPGMAERDVASSLVGGLTAVIVILLAVLAHARNDVWKSETALRLAPDHVLARMELGGLEESQGRISEAREQYRRALEAMGQEPRWGPARQFAQERLQRHPGGPSGAPSRGR